MKLGTQDVLTALDDILHTLHAYRDRGVAGFDCSPGVRDRMAAWREPLCTAEPPGPVPDRVETLEHIRRDLGNCERCGLCRLRQHIVFGAGDPGARLVFVGEGPGREEDLRGEPFVGAAGELLTRIIQAIKLTRDQVYICNIIKCRPPRNRNPLTEEIDACRPFLDRQLAAIQPEFIVALGKVAAQTLLGSEVPISRLRGRFHDYHGMRLLPTYHPAYLLRNPDKKRDVWEDMKLLMREYGHAP